MIKPIGRNVKKEGSPLHVAISKIDELVAVVNELLAAKEMKSETEKSDTDERQ